MVYSLLLLYLSSLGTAIVERQGNTHRIALDSASDSYSIYHPTSFSASGRYLVASIQVAYTGGDPGVYLMFFDLDNTKVVPRQSICRGLDFETYLGFISPIEVAILCTGYGDPTKRFEGINLQSGTIRQLSKQPNTLSDHGKVVDELKVMKTQIFR